MTSSLGPWARSTHRLQCPFFTKANATPRSPENKSRKPGCLGGHTIPSGNSNMSFGNFSRASLALLLNFELPETGPVSRSSSSERTGIELPLEGPEPPAWSGKCELPLQGPGLPGRSSALPSDPPGSQGTPISGQQRSDWHAPLTGKPREPAGPEGSAPWTVLPPWARRALNSSSLPSLLPPSSSLNGGNPAMEVSSRPCSSSHLSKPSKSPASNSFIQLGQLRVAALISRPRVGSSPLLIFVWK